MRCKKCSHEMEHVGDVDFFDWRETNVLPFSGDYVVQVWTCDDCGLFSHREGDEMSLRKKVEGANRC